MARLTLSPARHPGMNGPGGSCAAFSSFSAWRSSGVGTAPDASGNGTPVSSPNPKIAAVSWMPLAGSDSSRHSDSPIQ